MTPLRYQKVVTDGCSNAPSSVQTMKTVLPGHSKTQMFLVTPSIPVISCPKFFAPVPNRIMATPEPFIMSKIRKFKKCLSNMECLQLPVLKPSSSAWKANTFSTSGHHGDITIASPSKKTEKNAALDFKSEWEQRFKAQLKLTEEIVYLQIPLVKWLNVLQIRANRTPSSVMAGWTGEAGHHVHNHVAQMDSKRELDDVVSNDSLLPRASFLFDE